MNQTDIEQTVHCVEGINVPMGPHISPAISEIIKSGQYEQQELGIIRNTLEKHDKVLEIGAGLGLVSAFCAKRIGSERVFAVEANPQLEPIIRTLYALNGVGPELSMCILGDTAENKPFYIQPNFWSSSLTPDPDAEMVVVRQERFSEVIHRIDPSFLIVDIEGGEYDLLLNADLGNVRKILIEIHGFALGPERTNELVGSITRRGFRLNRRLSYTFRRRAYLRLADLVGGQRLDSALMVMSNLGLKILTPRGSDHENKYFEKV